MHRRPLLIMLLIIAFLLSAWSNVIGASFCPRYGSNGLCSSKHVVSKPRADHQLSCHHEMADMEMDDMRMETETSSGSNNDSSAQTYSAELGSSSDQVALDLPVEECPHCWSHSQPTSGSASLVTTDSSKQSVVTNLPRADLSFASPSTSLNSFKPSEHGPPGNSSPRHVLIGVFRI